MRARWFAPAVAVAVAVAVAALVVGPALGQASPTLRIVGFASTLGDGTNNPRVEAKANGTITRCRDKKALSAIFVIGNIAPGSRYQQYWSSRGKTVFMGKTSTLPNGISTPRRVYMGFTKKSALRNGTYIFQFILDGRPHVLGRVTRKC
jgi:hypothetical protein